MCWSTFLWHQKPLVTGISVDISVCKYKHAKETIINIQYFWMSELHLSWQRPQTLDLVSAKGSGSGPYHQRSLWTSPFTSLPVVQSVPDISRSLLFCALLRFCCCHLGLPRLLRLPFSAPCQLPQCLVGWPTAAWRSGTWSPSGCLLYCFQPIFCGSHGVACKGRAGV